MLKRSFMLLDVFTRVPFGGNRLTLFPDGSGLSTGMMQAIAREMCTGETAFIICSDSDSQRANMRIFTPRGEVPMSGLSLIGGTFALDRLGRIEHNQAETHFSWHVESGTHPVVITNSHDDNRYSLVMPPAEFIGQYYQRQKIARALGLDESDIAITGLPCEIVSTGLPIHIVPVGSLAAVRSINFSRAAASEIDRDLGFGDLFVFTCEASDAEADVHCRMFAHGFGIPEDPASGSASGALMAYMVKYRLVSPTTRVKVVCEQGLEMGRPSQLYCEADVAEGVARSIRVGGHCVMLGEGRLEFDTDAITF
jgi:trans-2,3-dihydro-3-hydroxyanthranilate isomerase